LGRACELFYNKVNAFTRDAGLYNFSYERFMLMVLNASQTASKEKAKSQKAVSHRARSTNPASEPIGKLQIKAHEQPHISLGNFTGEHPPKGFSIHITPDPDPDAIITQVTTLGSDKEYELILHIANYGNKTVNAKVWPL
jgi:hypothetical protein